MNTNHTRQHTVALTPTPAQCRQLQHLSWRAGLVRLLAHDQARLLADDGQDISVAGMLDAGQDHPDRSPEAEVRALQTVAETRGAPPSLLEAAIRAGRADHAAGRVPRRIDLPHHDICGAGLITSAGKQAITVAGVTGELTFNPAHLPHWTAHLWAWTDRAATALPALSVAVPSSVHLRISPRDDVDFEHWKLILTCRKTHA